MNLSRFWQPWFGMATGALLLVGCVNTPKIMEPTRQAWTNHDFAGADAQVNQVLQQQCSATAAGEGGVTIPIESGDAPLYALEKARIRMAMGDADGAVAILRLCRDELKVRRDSINASDYFTGLADDASLTFTGKDYEHMAIQNMLLVSALLANDPDAASYAAQIFNRQEELIGKPFGEDLRDENGNPVYPVNNAETTRSALGAYLLGLMAEQDRAMEEARSAYERAGQYSGGTPIAAEAVQRVAQGGDLKEGHGRVHVLYFAGRGPTLVEGTSPVTEGALLIANVASIAGLYTGGSSVGTLGQASIPVPVLQRLDPYIPPLTIQSDAGVSVSTTPLVDHYAIAEAQLESERAWVLARAVARRAVKALAAEAAGQAIDASGAGGDLNDLFVLFAKVGANAALTAGERADLRSWSCLPAQVQVARMVLPVGDRTLQFGEGMSTQVRVGAGQDTFVVIERPNLLAPGQIVVDGTHRIGQFQPVAVAAPATGTPVLMATQVAPATNTPVSFTRTTPLPAEAPAATTAEPAQQASPNSTPVVTEAPPATTTDPAQQAIARQGASSALNTAAQAQSRPAPTATETRKFRVQLIFPSMSGYYDGILTGGTDVGFLLGIDGSPKQGFGLFGDLSFFTGNFESDTETLDPFFWDLAIGGRYRSPINDSFSWYGEGAASLMMQVVSYSGPIGTDTMFGFSAGLALGAGVQYAVSDSASFILDYRLRFGSDIEGTGSLTDLLATDSGYSRLGLGFSFGM